MKKRFKVNGMTCAACQAHVDKAVRKVEGVSEVSVSLLTNTMDVEFDSDEFLSPALVNALIQATWPE